MLWSYTHVIRRRRTSWSKNQTKFKMEITSAQRSIKLLSLLVLSGTPIIMAKSFNSKQSTTGRSTWFVTNRQRNTSSVQGHGIAMPDLYIEHNIISEIFIFFLKFCVLLLETIVSMVFQKQQKITRMVQVSSVLRPDFNDNIYCIFKTGFYWSSECDVSY
jgi:hypothetical protein